jgi:hypothetical protein
MKDDNRHLERDFAGAVTRSFGRSMRGRPVPSPGPLVGACVASLVVGGSLIVCSHKARACHPAAQLADASRVFPPRALKCPTLEI